MSYEQPETLLNNKLTGACQRIISVNIFNSPSMPYQIIIIFLPAGFDIAYYLCWILLIILVWIDIYIAWNNSNHNTMQTCSFHATYRNRCPTECVLKKEFCSKLPFLLLCRIMSKLKPCFKKPHGCNFKPPKLQTVKKGCLISEHCN